MLIDVGGLRGVFLLGLVAAAAVCRAWGAAQSLRGARALDEPNQIPTFGRGVLDVLVRVKRGAAGACAGFDGHSVFRIGQTWATGLSEQAVAGFFGLARGVGTGFVLRQSSAVIPRFCNGAATRRSVLCPQRCIDPSK